MQCSHPKLWRAMLYVHVQAWAADVWEAESKADIQCMGSEHLGAACGTSAPTTD